MRRLPIVLFAFMLFICLIGCHDQNEGSVTPGTYIMEGVEDIASPYIVLGANNEFQFMYSLYSSYFNYGKYEISDSKLELTTDDGLYTYVFKIENGYLVFNAELSSELTNYEAVGSIVNGDRFVLNKNK